MAGQAFTRLGTYNMVLPPEGPKAYKFTLDFTADNTVELDFIQQIMQKQISFVQSVLVDNRLNANELELTTEQIEFPYAIPAGKQAYMPLFVTDSAKLIFRTPQALNLVVPCVVSNVPVTPYIW